MAAREALAGLAALPDLQRQVMVSTALDGASHEEVATALGLSTGSVRGLIYRARSTLRAAAAAVIPAPVIEWALGDTRQAFFAIGTGLHRVALHLEKGNEGLADGFLIVNDENRSRRSGYSGQGLLGQHHRFRHAQPFAFSSWEIPDGRPCLRPACSPHESSRHVLE